MNRSRETMQFIQALSAPTRASFSLYLEYKELLAFIPVIPTASVHRLPTGLLPPPSPSNRRVCVYQPDTTIEIRNVSIFFLLSLWTSSPLFFERGEKIVFVGDQPPFVEVDWSRMSDEKPVNRGIFQRWPAALLIVWNIYERQIRNVELEGLLSGFHHR